MQGAEASYLCEVTTLYRPVGYSEMEAIRCGGSRSFPPLPPHQSLLYPVLSEEYATAIAKHWNTNDPASAFSGFVTRFHVKADFLTRYSLRSVGPEGQLEYWIPAGDLPELNRHLVGPIEVIAQFKSSESAGALSGGSGFGLYID